MTAKKSEEQHGKPERPKAGGAGGEGRTLIWAPGCLVGAPQAAK